MHRNLNILEAISKVQIALKYKASNEIAEMGSEAQCTALIEASGDAALFVPVTGAFVPEAATAIALDNNGANEYTLGDGTLSVRVYYRVDTFIPDSNIPDPYGNAIEPRGLWGTFINQGAEKINGDAYLPKWDPRKWGSNDEYDPEAYYLSDSRMGIVWPVDAEEGKLTGEEVYNAGDGFEGIAERKITLDDVVALEPAA